MLQYSTEPRKIARIVRPSPQTRKSSAFAAGLFPFAEIPLNPSQLRWQPLSGHTDHSLRSGRASPLLQLSSKVSLTRMTRRWCAFAVEPSVCGDKLPNPCHCVTSPKGECRLPLCSSRVPSLRRLFSKVSLTRVARRWCAFCGWTFSVCGDLSQPQSIRYSPYQGSTENPGWFAFSASPAQSRRSEPFGCSSRSLLWGAGWRICQLRCISRENWWHIDKKAYDSLLWCASLAHYDVVFKGLWRKIWHFFVKVSRKNWIYFSNRGTESAVLHVITIFNPQHYCRNS